MKIRPNISISKYYGYSVYLDKRIYIIVTLHLICFAFYDAIRLYCMFFILVLIYVSTRLKNMFSCSSTSTVSGEINIHSRIITLKYNVLALLVVKRLSQRTCFRCYILVLHDNHNSFGENVP